jgi:hypothetical protein
MWYKTHGEVTVGAGRWDDGSGNLVWGIAAQLDGKAILLPDGETYYGPKPAERMVDGELAQLHMGFDVWHDGTRYCFAMSFEGDTAADFRTMWWKVDEDSATAWLHMVYDLQSGLTSDTDFDPAHVRLVGLNKNTPVYCRFGTSYYWYGPDGTKVDVGGEIQTVMWDPTRRTPMVHSISQDAPENVTGEYEWERLRICNIWNHPNYCSHCDIDGEHWWYGWACENATVNKGTTASMVVRDRDDTEYIVNFGKGVVHTAGGTYDARLYTYVYLSGPYSGTKTFLPDHHIGNVLDLDGGWYTPYTTSRFSEVRIDGTNESFYTYSRDQTVSRTVFGGNVFQYSNVKMVFDPGPNQVRVSYDKLQAPLEDEPFADVHDPSRLGGFGNTMIWQPMSLSRVYGDASLSGLETVWPFDNWKAVLLGGVDADAPTVIYANGLIRTADGNNYSDPAADAPRAFFTTKRAVLEE